MSIKIVIVTQKVQLFLKMITITAVIMLQN